MRIFPRLLLTLLALTGCATLAQTPPGDKCYNRACIVSSLSVTGSTTLSGAFAGTTISGTRLTVSASVTDASLPLLKVSDSSASGSLIQFEDAASSAANYLPVLHMKAVGTGGTFRPSALEAEPGEDAVTSPAFVLWSHLGGAALTGSDLFQITNNLTYRWGFGPTGLLTAQTAVGTSSTKGVLHLISAATSSTAPYLWAVDDEDANTRTGYLKIKDQTSVAGAFSPGFYCKGYGSAVAGCFFLAEPGADGTSTPAYVFDGRLSGASLVTSYVAQFRNFGANLLALDPAGALLFQSTTTSGTLASDTSASTASSTVGALTLAPTATLDANDLVIDVKSKLSGGSDIFTVDLEGDIGAIGTVLPSADLTKNLGNSSLTWNKAFLDSWYDQDNLLRIQVNPSNYTEYKATGTGDQHYFNTTSTVTDATKGLIVAANGSSTKWKVNKDGKEIIDSTDNSASPGATTINKPTGKAAIAAAASSVVVTNSTVATTSIVAVFLQTSDTTCTGVKSVIPAAGSFTVNVNAACTAAATVGFVVYN